MTVGLLLIATLTSPIASATATPPSGSVAGFSVRPAQFNPAIPVTRAYFVLTIPAGRSVTRSVFVGNEGGVPLTLRSYAADGLTAVTSGAVYSDLTDPLHAAGRWVTPSVSAITIGPHRTSPVSFEVTVPSNAAPGVHLAGIAFQERAAPATHGHFSVTEIFRVVVGVEIRVPGPMFAGMKLTGASIGALPGTSRAAIRIGILNSGDLICKPKLSVAVSDGAAPVIRSEQLDTILPGSWIRYPMPWTGALTPGSYRIAVHATRCGQPASLSAVTTVPRPLLPSNAPPNTTLPAPTVNTGAPLWLLALVGFACLSGGLAAGVVLARRSRRPTSPPHGGTT